MVALPIGGFGIVGLGVAGEPSKTQTRPDLCADHGHPGATYNPWTDKTWCLCGEVVRDGNHATHAACCDGPLVHPTDCGVVDCGEVRCDRCGERMTCAGPEPRACGTTCADCSCSCTSCLQVREELRADLERLVEKEAGR